jgi:ferrochelatase
VRVTRLTEDHRTVTPDALSSGDDPAARDAPQAAPEDAPPAAPSDAPPVYDALLLVSFGGPEGPDDVLPFLRNVTRGRGVPERRLAEVARHYDAFGGRSPINDQNRALLAALREELAPLPVYWGNRNWQPYVSDALASMRADGITRAACFMTSAFASYSGCRQYREDLADALAGSADPPVLDKLRLFFDHPGFVEPTIDRTIEALADLPEDARDSAALLFVAHSLPVSQAEASGPAGGAYPGQLAAVAGAVAGAVADRAGWHGPFEVAYSSRSGPPSVPWLGPDIGDRLAALPSDGVRAAVVVPFGFVSDHLEVLYDLDVEAAARARDAGVTVRRAATVGTDPRFVRMIAELLAERESADPVRPALTAWGPSHDVCPLRCCEPARRRPAAAGTPGDLKPATGPAAETATGPAAGPATGPATGPAAGPATGPAAETATGPAAGPVGASSARPPGVAPAAAPCVVPHSGRMPGYNSFA